MHYSQFCSAISDILRKNSDPGTQFIQKALCKNNGVCPDVLFALPADSALGPVVYLEPPVFRRSTRKVPSFSSRHFFISFPASRFFLYLQQIFNALLGLFLLKKFF